MSQILQRLDAASAGGVITLTGDTGGAVSPDGAGNIDLLGEPFSGITVTGTPASNLLEINYLNSEIFVTQTVGAVSANIFTITVADLSAIEVTARVIAANSDYAESFGGQIVGVARRSGGGVELSWEDDATDGDDVTGDVDVNFIASGNDYILEVTGKAATTINWQAAVTYQVIDV